MDCLTLPEGREWNIARERHQFYGLSRSGTDPPLRRATARTGQAKNQVRESRSCPALRGTSFPQH